MTAGSPVLSLLAPCVTQPVTCDKTVSLRVGIYTIDRGGLARPLDRGVQIEAAPQRTSGFTCASALNQTQGAMMHSYQFIGRWVAMAAICACVLAGCAQLNSGAGEGSSSPPSDSASYVFPSPDLQVYD
jgi:hypothetical protein